MNWLHLYNEEQLDKIVRNSFNKAKIIFKHSTRCSISSTAKGRLDRNSTPENTDFYYLDLIANRSLSNKVSTVFSIIHESPQILLIINGKCVYYKSHSSISFANIQEQLEVNQ